MGAVTRTQGILASQAGSSMKILLTEEKKGLGKVEKGDTFDISRVKTIGVFEDVVLFGSLDCYREDSRTGLLLDGRSLQGDSNKYVSGLCRLTITVEGAVYQGRMSRGMLQREKLQLRSRPRRDHRLSSFVGYEKQMREIEDTLYSQIAFVDCDIIFNTGVSMEVMRDSIARYTVDTEEMLLDLAAVDLVDAYKQRGLQACCMAISRLYVHPAFRGLGLSGWLLKNLPTLGQSVINKPVVDMLLIPGDFSGEAGRRQITRSEYLNWLREYYKKNGFYPEEGLSIKGIFRQKRLAL